MKKWLYKFIFFRLMGWKINGEIDKSSKKCVLMVIPHTSWHDFYLGIFIRGITGLQMNFIAKKELFIFPFGYYFRWMGGAAIDRTGTKNKVDTIAAIFEKREIFRLAISPEGTRKKVDKLKTGFYYIALKANVPIIPIAFDFGKKSVNIGESFTPTGNIDADINILKKHFIGVKGKFPEKGYEV